MLLQSVVMNLVVFFLLIIYWNEFVTVHDKDILFFSIFLNLIQKHFFPVLSTPPDPFQEQPSQSTLLGITNLTLLALLAVVSLFFCPPGDTSQDIP